MLLASQYEWMLLDWVSAVLRCAVLVTEHQGRKLGQQILVMLIVWHSDLTSQNFQLMVG